MKIPRNLKPGTKLWYSKTAYATVHDASNRYQPADYIRGWPPGVLATRKDGEDLRYNSCDGREVMGDTPPIIRIERTASAPAKVKRAKVDGDDAIHCARRLAKWAKQVVALGPQGSARYLMLDKLRNDFVRADRRSAADKPALILNPHGPPAEGNGAGA